MEKHVKESIGGMYRPSFLTMKLNTEEDLSELMKKKYSDDIEAAFFHEYIHLLQDLTTVSGLTNLSIIVDFMKWATKQIHDNKINVPLHPTNNDVNNINANLYLKGIALGNSKAAPFCTKQSLDHVYVKYENLLVNNILKKIEVGAIMELLVGDSLVEYRFGELAISESMAYHMESCCYPGEQMGLPDFPYRAVEALAEHFMPSKEIDHIKLVALCDACLLYEFPGKTMLKAFEEIKDRFSEMSPEEIFDYVNNDKFLIRSIPGLQNASIADLFDSRHTTAKKQMMDYFTTPSYKNTVNWIEQMFVNAYLIRKTHPYFMIDMAKEGKIMKNPIFEWALNEVGCPLIMNQNDEITYIKHDTITTDVWPPVFNIIDQIYRIFQYGKLERYDTYKCELINWCRKDFTRTGVPDLTSERQSKCFDAPWERTEKHEIEYCYFGQIWLTWGLNNVRPIEKKSL